MSIIDLLAEKYILAALRDGELDNLSGSGKPLRLDDQSHVPAELRASYRILKNAGYLPPELELRRDALELSQLLQALDPRNSEYAAQAKRLQMLENRLKQAGMSTDFLHGRYADTLRQRFAEEE